MRFHSNLTKTHKSTEDTAFKYVTVMSLKKNDFLTNHRLNLCLYLIIKITNTYILHIISLSIFSMLCIYLLIFYSIFQDFLQLNDLFVKSFNNRLIT